MPHLLIASGPQAGLIVKVGDLLEIGRSAGCRIRIHDDRASRVHARILRREGGIVLEDLGSRNGTLLNGERAVGFSRLHPGDRIRIGRTYFVFAPDSRLLPARFSGGLLLLDDTITVVASKPPSREKPGRRWEEELVAASRRLQAMTDPARIARGLAEEILRVLRARGVAIVEQGGGGSSSFSPMVIVGLPGIALPGVLLREVVTRGQLIEATVDRASSALVPDMEDSPSVQARLLLGPVPDPEGWHGAFVAELAPEVSAIREGQAVMALAALGGAALTAAGRAVRQKLAIPFHRRRIDPRKPTLLGESAELRRCVDQVREAAHDGGSLRLTGEPGSGRTLLACVAHQYDPGVDAPLSVYQPNFPEPQLARLFGAERHGDEDQAIVPGLLEQARGGTCVVQAFARLPRAAQARLLDTLEEGVIVREGGQRPVDHHGRLILIDDQGDEPSRAVARRMKGLGLRTVVVPPLRERALDLGPLFDAALGEACVELGRPSPEVSTEVRRFVARQPWPGNLPELVAFVAAALAVTSRDAPLSLPAVGGQGGVGSGSQSLGTMVRALEEASIREAMASEGGRKARVARRLGISRPTLDRKLSRYGL